MNDDLVVLTYPRAKVYIDRAPTLFGADKELADVLEKINIMVRIGLTASWPSAE